MTKSSYQQKLVDKKHFFTHTELREDQETNQKLKGYEGRLLLDKMYRSDVHVNVALRLVSLPIISADWNVSYEDEREDEILEFVKNQVFQNIKFKKFIREAVQNHLKVGFQAFEIVWKNTGEAIELDELVFLYYKYIQRFKIDEIEYRDWQSPKTVNIPLEKCALFVHEQEGENLYGTSILRAAYKDFYFKENLVKIAGMAAERHGLGLPVGKKKGGSTDDRDNLLTALENIRAMEKSALVLGDDEEFEYAQMNIQGLFDLMPYIREHSKNILLNVFGQFLELGGQGGSGSYALSETHKDMYYASIIHVAENVAEVINERIIKPLVVVNFGVQEEYPKISTHNIDSLTTKEMVDMLEKISDKIGAFNATPEDEVFWRKMLNLPDLTDEQKKKIKEAYNASQDFANSQEANGQEINNPNENQEIENHKHDDLPHLKFEKVEVDRLNLLLDKFEQELETLLNEAGESQREEILGALEGAMQAENQYEAIQNLELPDVKQYDESLKSTLKQVADAGMDEAMKEMGKTEAEVVDKDYVKELLEDHDDRLATYSNTVSLRNTRELYENAKFNAMQAISQKMTIEETIDKIRENLTKVVNKKSADASSVAIGQFFNSGRDVGFEAFRDEIDRFVYSSILDNRTSEICRHLDGYVVEPFSEEYYRITPPNHQGGCRSILVAILKDEPEKPEYNERNVDQFLGKSNNLIL